MKLFATALLLLATIAQAAEPPQHGQSAWMLADAASGEVELSHQSEQLMKPASTQKLVTVLAGALALGPDWRYTTHLRYRGALHQGRLDGDLLIDFVGDPTFTREQLAGLLRHSGIRHVSGRVLLNQVHFDGYDRGNGWSWNDLGVCYTAPAAALILDRNCVQGALYARAGQPARATVPSHQPVTVSAAVEVLNKAEREQRFCALELEMTPPNRYHLTGCIGPRQDPWPLRFAIQDVTAWGQQLTRWALQQAGITLSGHIEGSRLDTADWPTLGRHHSPPLSELAERILVHSDNLYADSLLRTLGRLHFNQPGSFRNGTQAVRDILKEKADIDLGPAWLADGSGLSAHNLLRAKDLMAVLLVISRDPRAQWLMARLPVSGESGTLRYRKSVLSPALTGRVIAKTGTIAHVQNLAGFIDTANGERKAFVLLQNGLSLSPEQEQAMADGELEWPARRFERDWLEGVAARASIVSANQSPNN
ncbi:D-alanyl-D-alanine carboxypeptidase/D-alanyl-D-alanine-endopeptidase [Oceanimonas sp. GK1]|uniref:D-alanyl-D-alanine carboxypeptidase/D-alanyl-D-alanine endopeptidase n=1 Tax=Oceanimonas sp. (strain GK1 / IBRC-M 10197) TaxID=511062 RepID=UPI0002495570|nr:D-alanyl-D-alanine carboxypeptidase/D-alanyl-D-alanine-endopeptidase [Oceanimonas sp. GK1]AEY01089.1 D-alanyl-D-alanine carboxypeptidase/D-alanyl-D-alanine-endopeptidase [Oceanimonas sp. GK1]